MQQTNYKKPGFIYFFQELYAQKADKIIMLTSYCKPPQPILQPFVDSYILCSSGGEIITMHGSWSATHHASLIFYLADKTVHYNQNGDLSALGSRHGCMVGLLSHSNGNIRFQGGKFHFIDPLFFFPVDP